MYLDLAAHLTNLLPVFLDAEAGICVDVDRLDRSKIPHGNTDSGVERASAGGSPSRARRDGGVRSAAVYVRVAVGVL